ncbi:MAG: DNA repair protein RecN [Fusobacteriia bacterium 4572_132]|nr:MAG: DNA repair protein RecN [Fusobacteriia bacterium 4572_132]
MLRELRIENLAIIKVLDLELEDGLIALTGETGAGKSIILDGINLLIGDRISPEMIRTEADLLMAEGVFKISEDTKKRLKELDMETEESEIIVRREISKKGRSKAFLNGRRIPLNELKNIMGTVVDLVGQHSHQMLLNKKFHCELVDKFLDKDGIELKEEIIELKEEYDEINYKIKEIKELKKNALEKKDLYKFQYGEIEEADLKLEEDEKLENEYKKLFNAGKIKEKLKNSLMILQENEQNAVTMISVAKSNLESVARYGDEFENMISKLDTSYYELKEVVYSIENSLMDIDVDEYRLNEVIDRLDKINNFKKKYGITIKEILEYKDEIKMKLDKLENEEFEEEILIKQKEGIYEKYIKKAKKLSQKRRKIGKEIEYSLIHELNDLNMKGIKFEVVFNEREKINKNGMDLLEFMIATNIGEELKPLTKIVSGGEVSRIMLALKAIFSRVDNIPILIFDEIDTGVGGETVRKVAEKLKAISKNVQVICITHSPNIASKANQHFYIEKKIKKEKTETGVRNLSYEEKIKEISRMIAGEKVSEIVEKHAIELLKEE